MRSYLLSLTFVTVFAPLPGATLDFHRNQFWKNRIAEYVPVQPTFPAQGSRSKGRDKWTLFRSRPRIRNGLISMEVTPYEFEYDDYAPTSYRHNGWGWAPDRDSLETQMANDNSKEPETTSVEESSGEDPDLEYSNELDDMIKPTPKPNPFGLHHKIIQIGMPIVIGLMAWYVSLMMLVTGSTSTSQMTDSEMDLKSGHKSNNGNIHINMDGSSLEELPEGAAGVKDQEALDSEKEKDQAHEKVLKKLDVTDQVLAIVERGLLLAVRKVELLNVVGSLGGTYSGVIPGGVGGGGGGGTPEVIAAPHEPRPPDLGQIIQSLLPGRNESGSEFRTEGANSTENPNYNNQSMEITELPVEAGTTSQESIESPTTYLPAILVKVTSTTPAYVFPKKTTTRIVSTSTRRTSDFAVPNRQRQNIKPVLGVKRYNYNKQQVGWL